MARKRRKSTKSLMEDFVISGFETADEIDGPVTQCIAYQKTDKKRKDGKGYIYRCATFVPSNRAGIVQKGESWVDWGADNRSKLKKPHIYRYFSPRLEKDVSLVNEKIRSVVLKSGGKKGRKPTKSKVV